MKELKRQLFHLFFGIVLVTLLYYSIIGWKFVAILAILGIIASLVYKKWKIPIIKQFVEHMERPKDEKNFPGKGIIFFLAGALIVLLLFEKNTALASIIILTLGDSISPIVGRYGKIKHPFNNVRYLEGTVAGIIAATLGAVLFVPFVQAFFASLVSMLVEAIELQVMNKKIDDNLIIPLISAIVISLIKKF